MLEGVLRTDVAADVALTHKLAPALRHSEPVPLTRTCIVECDREIRMEEALAFAKSVDDPRHESCLWWQLPRARIGRHRPDVEHVVLAGPVVGVRHA
jgi:hypothetical protein